MAHKPQVCVHERKGIEKESYYVVCNCRTGSPFQLTRQEADDWVFTHLQDAARALANLHRGRGSLRTDMDHAEAKIADPNVSAADKVSWKIIYDGARRRLGLPDPTKPPLPPHEGLW